MRFKGDPRRSNARIVIVVVLLVFLAVIALDVIQRLVSAAA